MNEPIETTTAATASRQGRCLVEGCPCKDSRIVSRRRVAFFAWLAAERGQTADRVIAPDAPWVIPGPSDAQALPSANPSATGQLGARS